MLFGKAWGFPVNSICRYIAGLEYIPANELKNLELEFMGFREDALLIRQEYITALNKFNEWSSSQYGLSGGVVVTGHPGSGAC